MAIKIISEKPIKTREVTCPKCGYRLQYTGEDVKESSGYYMGEYDVSYYIVCPRSQCQKHITVSYYD